MILVRKSPKSVTFMIIYNKPQYLVLLLNIAVLAVKPLICKIQYQIRKNIPQLSRYIADYYNVTAQNFYFNL